MVEFEPSLVRHGIMERKVEYSLVKLGERSNTFPLDAIVMVLFMNFNFQA